jgi:hypothetical protein
VALPQPVLAELVQALEKVVARVEEAKPQSEVKHPEAVTVPEKAKQPAPEKVSEAPERVVALPREVLAELVQALKGAATRIDGDQPVSGTPGVEPAGSVPRQLFPAAASVAELFRTTPTAASDMAEPTATPVPTEAVAKAMPIEARTVYSALPRTTVNQPTPTSERLEPLSPIAHVPEPVAQPEAATPREETPKTRLVFSEGITYRSNPQLAALAGERPAGTVQSETGKTVESPRIEVVIADTPTLDAEPSVPDGMGGSAGDRSDERSDRPSTHTETGHVQASRSGEFRVAETPSAQTAKPVSAERIMEQVREHLANRPVPADNGQISLRLNPEELGQLNIRMRMEEQHLRVEIVAENRAVRDALMQNLDTLRETLSRQNIVMERFAVTTGSGTWQQNSFREGRGSDHQRTARRQQWAEDGDDAVEGIRGYLNQRENGLVNVVL